MDFIVSLLLKLRFCFNWCLCFTLCLFGLCDFGFIFVCYFGFLDCVTFVWWVLLLIFCENCGFQGLDSTHVPGLCYALTDCLFTVDTTFIGFEFWVWVVGVTVDFLF